MIDLAGYCSFPTLSVFGENFVNARYFPIYAVAKTLALDFGRLLTPLTCGHESEKIQRPLRHGTDIFAR